MQWMDEIQRVSTLLFMIGGLLCGAAILAFIMRSPSVYAALSAVLGGALVGGLLQAKVGMEAVCVSLSAFAVCGGVIYLFFFCAFALRRLRVEWKKQRAEMAKRVQYTLPQRENTYVRQRLDVALNGPQDEETWQGTVPLGYARELLGKVQAAPLSVGERLQTEELGKVLTLYKGKENWTASELSGLNDVCAFLLKLSAKYTV